MAMAARGQVSWDRSGLDVDVMVVRNLDHSLALVTCRGLSSLPLASVLFNSLPRYGTGQVVSQTIGLREVMTKTGPGLRSEGLRLDLLFSPESAPEPNFVKSFDH